MKDAVLDLFRHFPEIALIISLLISIIIAILGVIPSFFITAANILFFGFWQGTIISFLGEALGAGVSFILYRKGFKKASEHNLAKFPRVAAMINAEGKKAFYLVMALRLFPFVPSGLITFGAALGKISFTSFLIASSIGKVPALLLEAYSVYQISKFEWQGKLILIIIASALIYLILKRNKRNHTINEKRD
jgi:uncharacterized membrane protein YdjX (TVP38/TMEM64 family)